MQYALVSQQETSAVHLFSQVVYSKDDGTLCFVFEFVPSNVFKLLMGAHRWQVSRQDAGAVKIAGAPSGLADDAAASDAVAVAAAAGAYSTATGSGLSETCIRSLMGQLFSGLSCMVSVSA
jgi:hypothetical protein